jgi:hypothetical protein
MEGICPICKSWIYQPVLRIDYKQTKKNALAMKHDKCFRASRDLLNEENENRKFKLEPNPNKKTNNKR